MGASLATPELRWSVGGDTMDFVRTHDTRLGTKMGHYKIGATRAEATDPKWLPIGKQIAELANAWAGRYDIVAYVGPGAGGPAPACFIPASAELEVNVDVAFGHGVEPSDIDLTTRAGRYEFPKAVGATAHEAFHAKHSLWDMRAAHDALAKDEYEALVLLEESRIEKRGLDANPRLLPFLRACAMEIVIADAAETFAGMSNTHAAAQLVGLVYARVDAGILDLMDVTEVTDLLDDYLGLDVIAALRKIAIAAQTHSNDRDATAMYDLAREWARIVREIADEKGDTPAESGAPMPSPMGGEPSEGEGSTPTPSEFVKAVMDALEEAAANVAVSNGGTLDDAETAERYEEVVKERADEAREVKDSEKVAESVFGGGKASHGGSGGSGSTLIEERAPLAEERIAANVVANMLEKAKYRERDITEIRSEIPGGRLRPRAIVQGAAMKAAGIRNVKVQPWERKVRRQTDEPTLTVGVMVDISGSMGSAMLPMATTAYVLSEATRRVQGKGAMVYFGNSVFPTLRKGEHLDKVRIYTAPDGTEKFDRAFRALNGELQLLHGDGARLLVIVSDGNYTGAEGAAAKRWMKRCAEEGVAVVWLPFDHGYEAKDKAGQHGTVLAGRFSPTDAALQIGKACADALTKMGQRLAA